MPGPKKMKRFNILCDNGIVEKKMQNYPTENLVINYQERSKRKYRKTDKPRKPRWWRTRKDPFEKVWPEAIELLECNPERTAKSLLAELVKRYPDKFNDSHLRTLQRRVKKWRFDSIITFDDNWLYDYKETKEMMTNQLRAVTV